MFITDQVRKQINNVNTSKQYNQQGQPTRKNCLVQLTNKQTLYIHRLTRHDYRVQMKRDKNRRTLTAPINEDHLLSIVTSISD